MSELGGSEQGWREASSDSRRHMKQRDIKHLVKRYAQAKKDEDAAREREMDTEYLDAALAVANGMQGNFRVGYSRAYARGYERAFREGG